MTSNIKDDEERFKEGHMKSIISFSKTFQYTCSVNWERKKERKNKLEHVNISFLNLYPTDEMRFFFYLLFEFLFGIFLP